MNERSDAPIGVFDSGVGGLTVARTLVDQLPHEAMIYIGDTAHAPYGPLPIAVVRAHAQNIADELVDRGCKMLVIACNTATSAFLRDARERYAVPVVGVILPAVRRAIATTRNGKIGVIGTEGTIQSGAYHDYFSANPAVEVFSQACPEFVTYVENGITSGRKIMECAEKYLAPLREAGVDTLVLGCTHYPLLSGIIQLTMGDSVTLVSSAEETAKDVFKELASRNLLASSRAQSDSGLYVFESTGDPETFQRLASRFLGPRITSVVRKSPREVSA